MTNFKKVELEYCHKSSFYLLGADGNASYGSPDKKYHLLKIMNLMDHIALCGVQVFDLSSNLLYDEKVPKTLIKSGDVHDHQLDENLINEQLRTAFRSMNFIIKAIESDGETFEVEYNYDLGTKTVTE